MTHKHIKWTDEHRIWVSCKSNPYVDITICIHHWTMCGILTYISVICPIDFVVKFVIIPRAMFCIAAIFVKYCFSNSSLLTTWVQIYIHFIIESHDTNIAWNLIHTNINIISTTQQFGQICQTVIAIDQSHPSHSVPIRHPTMHHPDRNMHMPFRSGRCTVGHPTGALRDPRNRSIHLSSGTQQPSYRGIFRITQHRSMSVAATPP